MDTHLTGLEILTLFARFRVQRLGSTSAKQPAGNRVHFSLMKTAPLRLAVDLLVIIVCSGGLSNALATGEATLRWNGNLIFSASDLGANYEEFYDPSLAHGFFLKAGGYTMGASAGCREYNDQPKRSQIIGWLWRLRFPTDIQLDAYYGHSEVGAWVPGNFPPIQTLDFEGVGSHDVGANLETDFLSYTCPDSNPGYIDAYAQSLCDAYANPRNIALIVYDDAWVYGGCQGTSWEGFATAEAYVTESFTLTNDTWAVMYTSLIRIDPAHRSQPPGGGASLPAPVGDGWSGSNACGVRPVYLWTNANSGLFFIYPGSGPQVQFDTRNGALFTSISNFPSVGSYMVAAAGVTNGPLTNGQTFSFADFPGGGVERFTLLPLSGGTEPMLPLQLTFNTPVADFEAQTLGPSPVAVLVNRLSVGLAPTGSFSNSLARGEDVRLDALVLGVCTNSYQWRREGVPLDGETNASLTLSNMLPVKAGRYSVTVSNELGLATSADIALLVPPPQIRLLNLSISTNTFQATMTGLPPGLELVMEHSMDLVQWQPVATNTSTTTNLLFDIPAAPGDERGFYRARTRW